MMDKTTKVTKTLAALFAILLIASLFASCKSNKKILPETSETASATEKMVYADDFAEINFYTDKNEADFRYKGEKGSPLAAVKIKDYGFFIIRLEKEIAPATVDNFIKLAKEGFYDNNYITNSFYGHSIRGGDKTGTGDGGAGYTIKGEPYGDGERKLSGNAGRSGAVSMYRTDESDYDSASSQFIVMIGSDPSYNGKYCEFGEVIYGMETLWDISKVNFSNIESEETAKLIKNLVIEKVLIDMNEG
ncbi:MAG: peptidylprolyl isomerase [Clostridia bacterium]|nr:peptidylprolyl isomerase [Clostridia bacterium]